MIRELSLKEKLALWEQCGRWAYDATHHDTTCEGLDEYRVVAGSGLQEAVSIIREQEATISGLLIERDEAVKTLDELSADISGCIQYVESYGQEATA